MVCRKCKKSYPEGELENGVCKECTSKSKTNMIIQSVITIFISVFISLFIIGLVNSEVSLSDFKIESFNMETEKKEYTYSEDLVTYNGEGKISCNNKENDYIVLIEEKNKTNNEINYDYVIVHNGEGKFKTYDSNYLGTKEKPSYEINIIGYRSFKK